MLLSLLYHLQKNMIINPIELYNPSVVADPGGALPSVLSSVPKQKLLIGLLYASERTFLSLRF